MPVHNPKISLQRGLHCPFTTAVELGEITFNAVEYAGFKRGHTKRPKIKIKAIDYCGSGSRFGLGEMIFHITVTDRQKQNT